MDSPDLTTPSPTRNSKPTAAPSRPLRRARRKDPPVPIHPDQKALYPPNWPEISRRIRFERAGKTAANGAAPPTTGFTPRPDPPSSYPSPTSTTIPPTTTTTTWPRSARAATTNTTRPSAPKTASTTPCATPGRSGLYERRKYMADKNAAETRPSVLTIEMIKDAMKKLNSLPSHRCNRCGARIIKEFAYCPDFFRCDLRRKASILAERQSAHNRGDTP